MDRYFPRTKPSYEEKYTYSASFFFQRDFTSRRKSEGKKSARPFVSTVCGRVDERGKAKETVGGRVGQTGHGYATDGVVRGQKPDIADRSTRSAPLTGILVT